jgi:uncharacterized protein (TIGR02757 family)
VESFFNSKAFVNMIQSHQSIKAKSLVNDLLAVEKLQLDKEQIKNDPLSYPLKFLSQKDQEVAAFISSCLAYGNVKQILKTLNLVFSFLGPSPYEKLITSRGRDWKKIIPQDLKHRFNSAEDIGILLTLLGEALRKHESLEKTFENSIKKNDLSANATLSSKLESFIDELTGMNTGPSPLSLLIADIFAKRSSSIIGVLQLKHNTLSSLLVSPIPIGCWRGQFSFNTPGCPGHRALSS